MMFSRYLGTSSRFIQDAPAPGGTSRSATQAEHAYELEKASDYFSRPDILEAWERMLENGESPEPVYQSPQFFRYLNEKEASAETAELFIVRRKGDGRIVGFVPVRFAEYSLPFTLGRRAFYQRSFRMCQVLGSLPLVDPAEKGLCRFVLNQLLAQHSDCQALNLQSVPQAWWHGLGRMDALSAHVDGGWRACHTQPLPDSVETYLSKFNAKKRYNLARQARLLEKTAGSLELLRIEQPADVPALFEAMAALSPDHAALLDTEGKRHRILARHGMLLSYVLRCGGQNVAVIYGTCSSKVWHIYNIVFLQKCRHLSLGTTALHLATQDALASTQVETIDFGYGTPNADFRSTHVQTMRGRMLLCRRFSTTALLFKLHAMWGAFNDALVCEGKKWHKRLVARRI